MDFSAALFAGGRSSRMGRDKAFIEVNGVPLWQRQLATLQALSPFEIFVAGPERPEWREYGLESVVDAAQDSGPMSGLVAVLRRCRTTHLVVLAIDLPNVTAAFLRNLVSMCGKEAGVVGMRSEQFEPLAAVYSEHCLSLAEECLSSGSLSLQEFVRRAVKDGLLRIREITDAEELLFFNLNTPADIIAIERK